MRCLNGVLAVASFCLWTECIAQSVVQEKEVEATAADKQQFLYFTIPVILNGSNMDPSPVEAFAFEFKGSKATFKTGFKLGGSAEDDKGYRVTFTAKPYVKASDDKATVYSKGEWAADYGCDFGLNWIFSHSLWLANDTGVKYHNDEVQERNIGRKARGAAQLVPIKLADPVSETVHWLSIRYSHASERYTLFRPGASYTDLVNKTTYGLGSVFLAYNLFFQSKLKMYRARSCIVSVGAGYGSFSNYLLLDERTLLEGTIVYGPDSTSYRTVAETTDGRSGALTIREGFTGYAEAYFPLFTIDEHGGRVRVGARVSTFGPGTDTGFTTVNGGAFVTARKKDKSTGKEEDKVNVSLTANFDRITSLDGSYDLDKYFSLQLGVAVPLRF